MMIPESSHNYLNNFCVAGINYRKSDISVRGKFSLLPEHAILVLQQAVAKKFPGCMVLSTCNRTEIYGICSRPNELIEMLCIHTQGSMKDFIDQGYLFQGISAVTHLFKVGAGLDSQIIGDYEILSQLKKAAKQAKENNCLNGFMERVINYALHASKEIKTVTQLSSGIVSVAYAAIEIIKERVPDLNQKKILLVGTGKFGKQIGKNLKDYLPHCSLFFSNRTDGKALALSEECGGQFVLYKNVASEANTADIIIVSSAAETYTILPSFFTKKKSRLILDLSVPQNVAPSVQNIDGITLLNVDEISVILDKTIALREEEIPKAMSVIKNTIEDLWEWNRKQLNSPTLRKVKSQLHEMGEAHIKNQLCEERIQKTVSSLAVQLMRQNNKGCQCINALNSYLQMN